MTIQILDPAGAAGAHVVQFYDSEDVLYSMVGDFLSAGAAAGQPLVLIARERRNLQFAAELRRRGVDPEVAAHGGRLVFLDAGAMLDRFMDGGLPDARRFAEVVGGVIGGFVERFGGVRAYGEMVDVLWQDGNPEAAVRLEQLWNELAGRHAFSLFCAYPIGNFLKESDRGFFDAVCAEHTHVVAAEAPSAAGDQSRLVAALQQRTLALETEIRQRAELEQALCEALAARRAAEFELRRLYEVAQAANRAKDQFLATLSHELRTPLTAILGWARLLTIGGLDDALVRTAHETIERSARTQASIVDDLLDLARIVTGKVTVHRDLVDLHAAVEEAVQTCRLAADAKRIDVNIVTSPERAVVMGDPTRLRQIVWNLFSNAVKYSSEGGRVTVTVERSARAAKITVRDEGRGIDQAFLSHVFEPFRQADTSTTRGYGGLGLGLTIVKHLTELHGGTIEARSDGAGRGATFVVMLPLVQANAAPAANTPLEISLAGHDLVVVDDDASSAQLLSAVLRRFGAEVRIASSASEALEAVRLAPPHALVTDIALGRETGFELLIAIRAECGDHAIPVIAVTALSEPGTEQRIETAGFDAYLRKPVDPVVFAHRIATLLHATDRAVN